MNRSTELEHRVRSLASSGKANNVRAIGDFRSRWKKVSKEIDQLPEQEMEAAFDLMYSELEEVLMAFELFAVRRKQSMPVQRRLARPADWRN